MDRLSLILNKMKKLPCKPKYTNLQLQLMKQEKEGREKQHKKMVKELEKYEKKQNLAKQKCPTPVSVKSPIPKKLELTKAQKALHKKVFGKKKTVYVSPVKSPKTTKKSTKKSAKKSAKKSPKLKTSPVKSAKSNSNNNNNSTSSVSSESIHSVISNKSMNYGSN